MTGRCSEACGWCGRCDDDPRGIERTCQGCGEPVFVGRVEPYVLHVYCDRCAADARDEMEADTRDYCAR